MISLGRSLGHVLGLPLLTVPIAALAETLVVNPDGSGDYPTIKAAIEAATEGDTIELGEGVFVGSGNRNLNFAGKNLVMRSIRGAEFTIVDLDQFPGDQVDYNFVTLENGQTAASVIEGITIRERFIRADGGAIHIEGASPTIRGLVFRDFYSVYGHGGDTRGGAIFIESGSPSISDCLFEGFLIRGNGGAIYAWRTGPITIENCVFRNNVVLHSVVVLDNGTIVGCTFESNGGAFPDEGPGVHVTGSQWRASRSVGDYLLTDSVLYAPGTVSVVSCKFIDNFAHTDGAISGPDLVQDCLFIGNAADFYGVGGGRLMSQCTFASNHGHYYGGVGAHEVRECLFYSNDVRFGAVVEASIISGCSFYQNDGPALGSGSVDHTIIAFGTGPPVECGRGATFSCCDLYGNTGGDWIPCIADQLGKNGNMSANPLFCDANADNFSLFSNSPCAPANSNGCDLIGAFDVGCAPLSVGVESQSELKSWGKIKELYR